jgi:hypothetical protein
MKYLETVQKIQDLPWEVILEEDLLKLMVMSAYTATEFAESLRIALNLHPNNKALTQMADGELMTTNLSYGEYRRQRNDHAAFLWHYINKHNLTARLSDGPYPEDYATRKGIRYHQGVRRLSRKVRAMSVFSREEQLPEIFRRVLTSPKDRWTHPALRAFRYYLETHIRLDSQPGGHQELISGFEVTDEVNAFYEVRFELYSGIVTLPRTIGE